MYDSVSLRLRRKSLSNELAIAVGSSLSSEDYSIPALAAGIASAFSIDFRVDDPLEYFVRWNEFVKKAEETTTPQKLVAFVKEKINNAKPTFTHRMIARIPVSNFIDTTFDRVLYKALLEAKREPILHDWGPSQMVGVLKQSHPQTPNLFFMLPNPVADPSYGVYDITGKSGKNQIQIVNIDDMLQGKDLLLINYSAYEADGVLHLQRFITSCEKIINYTLDPQHSDYWSRLGVLVKERSPEELITRLLPFEQGTYSDWDGFIASTPLTDVMREKEYDCFISYFSGDSNFVDRLERDLRLREIEIWRDKKELEIGDPISTKIEQGLSRSYSFIIVLSPEALNSPWVMEELNAAYEKRISGEIKIFPVLHKECKIPPLLAGYARADFRDERRYDEELGLLTQAIKNNVRRAREKM